MKSVHCFICSEAIDVNSEYSLKNELVCSKAPILLLLSDVLGYRFEGVQLHSDITCKNCYKIITTIDELQQTLTESKTGLKRVFLESYSKCNLKYESIEKLSNGIQKNAGKMTEVCREPEQIRNGGNSKVEGNQCNSLKSIEEGTKNGKNINEVVYDSSPPFVMGSERLKAGTCVEVDGSSEYLCAYCISKQTTAYSLKMHVRAVHWPLYQYSADQTSKIGVKLQDLRNLQNCTTNVFCCIYCDCSFQDYNFLNMHYNDHHAVNIMAVS